MKTLMSRPASFLTKPITLLAPLMITLLIFAPHALGAPADEGFDFIAHDYGYLTDFSWNHYLLDDRLALVAGFVSPAEEADGYRIVDPWGNYGNPAFSTLPTLPLIVRGLGVAARFQVLDRLDVAGGLMDANSDSIQPEESVDSILNQSEYFTHVKIGWTSSNESRFSSSSSVTFFMPLNGIAP